MKLKLPEMLVVVCLALCVTLYGCGDEEVTAPAGNGGGGGTPAVNSIYPPGAHPGYSVKVAGVNFGAVRDASVVTFGGEDATQYDSWSDNEIEVVMPGQAASFMSVIDLTVTVGGKQSAAVSFHKTLPNVILLTPDGVDMTHPCWAGNTTIYFTRYITQGAELTANIWRTPSGGGPLTQRTFYNAITDFPTVGSASIAYRSNHDGQFDIYESSGTGNEAHITNTEAKDFEVAMSPGVGGIAYSKADSLHGGLIWNIYVDHSAGSTQISTGNKDFHPTWSNMGTYIAFQRTHGFPNGSQIITIPRWGGTEVEVTPYGESCAEPDWNQAYDVIAFRRGLEIYIRNPDGTGEKQLTFDHIHQAQFPAWSQNGRELAWVDFMGGHYVVFVADVHEILTQP